MNSPDSGFPIDILCLSESEALELRALFAEWQSAHDPASPVERALVEQAVLARFEKRRLLRLRAVIEVDKARTAQRSFRHAIEDDVLRCWQLFQTDSAAAVNGLNRSAEGMRELINKWERLEKLLDDDGTWFGVDMIDSIRYQGFSPIPQDLCYEERAYLTWFHCLGAQPNPKPSEIELILHPDIMPRRLHDKEIWPADPETSRRYLRALVTRELARLRREEHDARTQYEEPARAAAKSLALARLSPEEVHLQREIRHHDAALQRAAVALAMVRRQAGASQSRGRDIEENPHRREPRHGNKREVRDPKSETDCGQCVAQRMPSAGS